MVVMTVTAGCASPRAARDLHVVDGALVRTPNAPSAAYEAYLRGLLAMEALPARPAEAQLHFRRAAALDPDEALLWVSCAEASYAIGDVESGDLALARALALDPAEPRALAMSSQLGSPTTAAEESAPQTDAPMSEAR